MTARIKKEYGDFQTPRSLAVDVCDVLARRRFVAEPPRMIVEPTCGEGALLQAAAERFPEARSVGFELNSEYVAVASERVPAAQVCQADFFDMDWTDWMTAAPQPMLVIGNPPWVTNSELSGLDSSNLPKKSNFQRHRGLDAITGKSNFDISEWMLLKLAEAMNGKVGALAMLCKTSVARKILSTLWRDSYSVATASLFGIDALVHFGASVDACLLVIPFAPDEESKACHYFASLSSGLSGAQFGLADGTLVANLELYRKHLHLSGCSQRHIWRSGVKHDCAKVMELRTRGEQLVNGLGEQVDMETDLLYPMVKSSDLANNRKPSRWMLVPQKQIGQSTAYIRELLPMTWKYLVQHAQSLDNRKSSIYKNRPRFSIFGIGDYTFAPWKVAISGFYKHFAFRALGPVHGKPIVLDDTCYFLPCGSEREATVLTGILNSRDVREFFESRVFWDTKRPVTSGLLRSLNLEALLPDGPSGAATTSKS